MAYNEKTAERLREAFERVERHAGESVAEKRMFGGLTFMVGGKMCVGVLKDDLVVRIPPERWDGSLTMPHTRPMDFTGKPMVGFLYVAPDGHAADADLDAWI